MSPRLFLLRQRCAWWTVVPTARASAVCVTARKAGQDQNVSRGTVTHAASTTESAERASVTATRAGRVNTVPLVSHDDTYSTVHLHTLDRRARTTEEMHLWTGLKGQLWSVNVSIFSAVSTVCWKDTDHDTLPLLPTHFKQVPLHDTKCFLMIFSVLRGKVLCFLQFRFQRSQNQTLWPGSSSLDFSVFQPQLLVETNWEH